MSKVLDETIGNGVELLDAFHRSFAERPSNARSPVMLDMLQRQIVNRQEALRGVATRLKRYVQAEQRNINRVFRPLLQSKMKAAFDRCANESGRGMYDRMRSINLQHAQNNSPGMFTEASAQAAGQLTTMIAEVDTMFVAEMTDVVNGLCSVFNNADIATDGWGDDTPPPEHDELRQNVLIALSGAELELKRAAAAPLEVYANDLRDDEDRNRYVDGISYVDKEEYTPHPQAQSASHMFLNSFGDNDEELYGPIGQQSQGGGRGSGSGAGSEMFCSPVPAEQSYEGPVYGGLIE